MTKRVLVVDDEQEIADVVAGYLEREGFEPVVRGDVRSSIETLNENRPDLMITDITLPDGSGLEYYARSLSRSSLLRRRSAWHMRARALIFFARLISQMQKSIPCTQKRVGPMQ